MNKAIIMGNITHDPEIIQATNGTKVAKFGVATNEKVKVGENWEDKATFHNVVAWKQKAEVLEKYFSKGDKILIEGKINYQVYDKKDGTKGYRTEIIAQNIEFTGKNKEKEQPQQQQNTNTQEDISVDDLPF